MKLLRRPISASDRIPDRFYVISMEFLSLSRRRSSSLNVPSGEQRRGTDVFAGYYVFKIKARFFVPVLVNMRKESHTCLTRGSPRAPPATNERHIV